jgi:hypothetical protein
MCDQHCQMEENASKHTGKLWRVGVISQMGALGRICKSIGGGGGGCTNSGSTSIIKWKQKGENTNESAGKFRQVGGHSQVVALGSIFGSVVEGKIKIKYSILFYSKSIGAGGM